jgi:tetraacyldisaccharide 4'-kinase
VSRAGLLDGAYGRVALMRRAWYARAGRRRRLHHRVISVGNLSVGGSGKTPVVAALASLLLQRGERPVILTRGYGRREATEGVLVVSDGQRVLEPVARSGDEPQLLARTLSGVPVLVCADRYIAGLFAERHFGVTVSILDDGFQHVQLERDIDLLIVPAADLDDRVLPSGRLREPLSAAHFADAVLVPGSEEDVAQVAATLEHHNAFRVVPHYEALQQICRVQKDPAYTDKVGRDPAYTDNVGPDKVGRVLSPQVGRALSDQVGRVLSDPPGEADKPRPTGERVIAFAGIARPERFFDALRSLGYDVARELAFRDHHWYTARDREVIQSAAREADAALVVTTAKDAVRCDFDVAVLPMTVSIEPAAAFESWLIGRLAAGAAQQGREGG